MTKWHDVGNFASLKGPIRDELSGSAQGVPNSLVFALCQ